MIELNKENYNDKLMYSIIAVLIISMVFIDRGIQEVSIVVYFGLVLLSVILPLRFTIYFIALLSPINRVFILESVHLTLIPLLISIASVKAFFKSGKIDIRFLILFLLLFIINSISAYVIHKEIAKVIYFFIYLFFAYIVGKNSDRKLYFNSAKYFIIGSLISCFGGHFFSNVADRVQGYKYIDFYRYMGLLSDSTEFGQKIIVAISLMVSLMLLKVSNKYISILVIGVLTYYLTISGTRSTLIGMLVILLYIAYEYIRKTGTSSLKKVLKLFIFIPLLPLFYYRFIFSPLIGLRSSIHEVFFQDRFEIWLFYLNIFINNLSIFMFGIGAGSSLDFSASIQYTSLHNGFFEILFEFGIVGSLLLLLLINKFYIKKNVNSRSLINTSMLPLFVYLSTLLSLGITRSEIPFLLIAICNHTNKEVSDF